MKLYSYIMGLISGVAIGLALALIIRTHNGVILLGDVHNVRDYCEAQGVVQQPIEKVIINGWLYKREQQ